MRKHKLGKLIPVTKNQNIKNLEMKLGKWQQFMSQEDTWIHHNYHYIDPSEFEALSDLRHIVIRTHIEIEDLLRQIISWGLLSQMQSSLDINDFGLIHKFIFTILERVLFRGKNQSAYKLGLTNKKLYNQLTKIDKMRDKFAHGNIEDLVTLIRNKGEWEKLLELLLEVRSSLESIYDQTTEPLNKKYG